MNNQLIDLQNLIQYLIQFATVSVLFFTLRNQAKNQKEEKQIKLFTESLERYENFINNLSEYYQDPDHSDYEDWLKGDRALQAIIENSIKEYKFYETIRYNRSPIINPLIKNLQTSFMFLLDLPEEVRNKYKALLKNSISYSTQRLLFMEKRYIEYVIKKRDSVEKYEKERIDFFEKVNAYNLLDDLSEHDRIYLRKIPFKESSE
ncbi:hypothetical protein FRE64_17295 (plasmid) [Euhalothece natronophila Z-M001]|uniref:DUF4760 domain-containing protein n=1 Tax=Euhalothece natronophila Z-M001 TaxID=522448 RepID=A0A5B8NRN8_9CHRO|nr:hypothetical protein [Euhalothece natronophila]QDZ41701.1 hypothetical protein FRE64_17215 [Euhalothece natronophila Z-M001]QDZ41716.1 hypothetical protein FRE64_17295 [Euhalothece natronophila Z-M001]